MNETEYEAQHAEREMQHKADMDILKQSGDPCYNQLPFSRETADGIQDSAVKAAYVRALEYHRK